MLPMIEARNRLKSTSWALRSSISMGHRIVSGGNAQSLECTTRGSVGRPPVARLVLGAARRQLRRISGRSCGGHRFQWSGCRAYRCTSWAGASARLAKSSRPATTQGGYLNLMPRQLLGTGMNVEKPRVHEFFTDVSFPLPREKDQLQFCGSRYEFSHKILAKAHEDGEYLQAAPQVSYLHH